MGYTIPSHICIICCYKCNVILWTGGCGVVSQCSPHFTPHCTPRLNVAILTERDVLSSPEAYVAADSPTPNAMMGVMIAVSSV